jgi:hypothetical protein
MLDDPIYQNLKKDLISELSTVWCSKEKIELLMDLVYVVKPKVCVEIGVFSGSSLIPVAVMLKYLQHGMVFAVDAWSNAEATKYIEYDDPNLPGWSAVDLLGAHIQFIQRLGQKAVQSYCTILRNPSAVAAQFIGEIDFLHLDGDYTEKGSLEDVALYLPKVKSGGYILLSSLFVMVKGKATKMKAFSKLFDHCEMICQIDRDNVILFRKS